MADDNYDDVIAAGRSQRESAAREQDNERLTAQRISQFYFHRRNTLFPAISQRARELQERYPDLGQLFPESFGDQLRLQKSKFPTGTYVVVFDEQEQVVEMESEYQNHAGSKSLFEIRPTPEGLETVELWSDGRAWTDDEIVKLIFDEFITRVA